MRILVSSPLYPPDIGGPALYAKRLTAEFQAAGHEVRVVRYGAEKRLPVVVRHVAFLFKALPSVRWADRVLVLDTFSAGVPTAVAALLLRKPYAARIGGDFLWEAHLERTRSAVPLPSFYTKEIEARLTRKERAIFRLTGFVLAHSDAAVFTTPWLRDIWVTAYGIDRSKCAIVENAIELGWECAEPARKVFLWAGRDIFLKNIAAFKRAFDAAKRERPDIEFEALQLSRKELQKRIARCYAVVVPSISEVSPNFATDAVRHGKPFLLTKHNGLAADVRSLGFEIDPASFDDMKAKILLMADDAEYARLKEGIRRFGRTRSFTAVAREFLGILERPSGAKREGGAR